MRLLFFSLFLAALAQSVIFFIFPFLNIIIYDNLVVTLDRRLLLELVLVIALMIVSVVWFSLVLDTASTLLRTKVSILMRCDLLDDLLNYQYRFYVANETGQIIQKIIPDIDVIAEASSKLFLSIAYLAQLILLMVITLAVDTQIFQVYLALVFGYIAWLMVCRPYVVRTSQRIGAEYGALYSFLYEVFPGIKEIKYFGLNGYIKERMLQNLSRMRRQQILNSVFNSIFYMSHSVVPWVGFCVILVVGLEKIESGKFTIGLFVAIFGFMWRIFTPIDKMTEGYLSMQEAGNAVKRIRSILGPHHEKGGPVRLDKFTSSVEFRDVSFSYAPDREILKDVSFSIGKGQNVAFVGRSGSGKTTVAHLLVSLFDGFKGKILIDGVELPNYNLESLRRNIGIVSQDIYLFNDTIMRNIDFSGTIEEARILEYCRHSHLEEMIARLPDGLHTVIGERGVKLSGGEKQRLALARTFAKNSEIIIFDEATSALDPQLERQVKESILRLNQGRTTITITHRPNTVVGMDRIYALLDGKIVEQGNHEELIGRKGYYYELFYQA